MPNDNRIGYKIEMLTVGVVRRALEKPDLAGSTFSPQVDIPPISAPVGLCPGSGCFNCLVRFRA